MRINPEIGPETLEALKNRGHKLVVRSGPLAAAPSVISVDVDNLTQIKQIRAAGDPRAGRHALAY
jgi:hypothetical protein